MVPRRANSFGVGVIPAPPPTEDSVEHWQSVNGKQPLARCNGGSDDLRSAARLIVAMHLQPLDVQGLHDHRGVRRFGEAREFSFGGMPHDDVYYQIERFADRLLPGLKG